ncbi:hypothetical protein ACV35N_33445, partial [Pseudomonas aeruginosa]
MVTVAAVIVLVTLGHAARLFLLALFHGGRLGHRFGNRDIRHHGRLGTGSSRCFLGSLGTRSFLGLA